MKKCAFLIGLLSYIMLLPAFADGFSDVAPGDAVSLPRDLYHRKDYRIQWWYFTGHLYDETVKEFGYELTFFAAGVQERRYESEFGVNNIYISHFAVTNVAERKYYFSDVSDSGAFGFAGAEGDKLKVWVAQSGLSGNIEHMRITASDKNSSLTLSLTPLKPPVLHGKKGYSRKSEKSPLVSSLYFSFTAMDTEGTLRTGGKTFNVKGKSWFDREISSKGLSSAEDGWDWFAVQLNDAREIMLYLIRKKDGSVDPYSSGTMVFPDGTYRNLAVDEFTITALDHYKSSKTGARYPAGWEISIPSEKVSLVIIPLVKEQEFIATHSSGNYYWEGTCKVTGSASGRAYVELTGY
jgi:predicted secreted hydrolase